MSKSLIEISSDCIPSFRKRRTVEERMAILGIEDRDYQKYEEMFLRPRERHHYLIHAQDRWTERKHSWNKNLVLRHFAGEQTIGLFPADWIDYLMIDIDRHDNESEANLKSRIKEITKVIDGDPLIYQSSFSGGIRLCYFFENGTPRDQLYQGYKRIFLENGIPVQPGVIEILATKKADRLPFGRESHLVDLFDLEPIYHLSLKETIAMSFEAYRYCKIELPFTVESGVQVSIATDPGDGLFDSIANRLIEEGLYPGITTTDALLKLSWDLQLRKGCSKQEAERFLTNWIMTKHNNLSNRFNAGRMDQIRDQIHRIVIKTDPSKAKYPGSKYALRKKRLSLSDVCRILTLTESQKLQLAIFSLLEYCLCFGKKAQRKNEEKTLISNIYVSGKGDVPYRSGFTKDFYCAISKQTLQHSPGFDKDNPQKAMQKIIELGVLSLKREAHHESHHCRQYWVHFRFDENDPVKVVSLDEGLLRLRELNQNLKPLKCRNLRLCNHQRS